MSGIELPDVFPRWADDPPSAPPSTITEPSEDEKAEGFQPGFQAQKDQITIDTVANDDTYVVTIDGTNIDANSDSDATQNEIANAIAFAINHEPDIGDASGGYVHATVVSDNVHVVALTAGQAFELTTEDDKLSIEHIDANRSGKPIRQYFNWLFNTIYLWINWLYYTTFNWGDIGGVDTGAGYDVTDSRTHLPSTGARVDNTTGLAMCMIQGQRATGLDVAHTYSASKDTYVDLNNDGTFSFNEVANGGSEPSLNPLARRQWKVVTDASNVTSVTDLRSEKVPVARHMVFQDVVEYLNSANADDGFPEPAQIVDLEDTFDYTLVTEGKKILDPTAAPGTRLYIPKDGGFAIAIGCKYNQDDTAWFFDEGALDMDVATASLFKCDALGGWTTYEKQYAGAIDSTSWTDGIGDGKWDGNQQINYGQLSLGSDLLDTAAHAITNRLNIPAASLGVCNYTLLVQSGGGTKTRRIYAMQEGAEDSTGADAQMGPGLAITINAYWDPNTNQWTQDASGTSTKTEIGDLGIGLLYFTSGSPTSLDDTIDDADNWNRCVQTDISGNIIYFKNELKLHAPSGLVVDADLTVDGGQYTSGDSTVEGTLSSNTSTESPNFKPTDNGTEENALYKWNLVKARGCVQFSNSSTIDTDNTDVVGGDATVAATGAYSELTITLNHEMPNDHYTVVCSSILNGSTIYFAWVASQSTTEFKIRLSTTLSANRLFASGDRIHFAVL